MKNFWYVLIEFISGGMAAIYILFTLWIIYAICAQGKIITAIQAAILPMMMFKGEL